MLQGQLSVPGSGSRKADHTDAASAADIAILHAIGGPVDDVDEHIRGILKGGRLCSMLPRRSRISTMSVGLEAIACSAPSVRITSKLLPQEMRRR